MKNNTYIQDKNFKNLSFSKGENMTEKDLEIVASRSKRTYVKDDSYESFLKTEEFSSHIYVSFDDTELFDEENQF